MMPKFSKDEEQLPRSLRTRLSNFHMRPPDDDEPQDWWIASTAIPLIAATTGPLANLMSIIALVIPWRNNIHWDQMGVEGTPVQVGYLDPRWCIALNATSLACGLVGNIFLLCNFTRMVRYIVALPVSIFLWLLSTAILIGLTVSMYIYESPTPPNQTFSQAYWSAVISAVLYFLLSIMLMINMLGYFLGHYPQNFILTDDQRTLILQTIGFITWLAIGGAIFTQAIEGISYADAVYFSDVTILTLGFGDITSSEPVGRGIILPYAVIGMVMLGLVVSSIHRFAQEIQEDNVVMNHIQRKRKKVVQRSTSESISNSSSELDIEYHQRHSRRKPIIATINPFTLARESRRSRAVIMKEEKDRFAAMRAIQNETARYRRWTSLWISILAFAIVWTCGAVVFWALEDNMSYFNALYFGFCCLLTIGYGDFTPTTNASRPFFIVWSLIAVPTMTTLISKMSDTLVRGYKRATGFVATWTFFPQSGQYRAVLGKYPRIGKVLLLPFFMKKHAEQEVRRESASPELEKGKEVHQESSQSPALESQGTGGLSLESLAQTPTPTNQQLAQHLAHAIQTTIKDSMADEPKKYTYEEWVAFTRLIRFTDPNRTSGGDVLEEDEYGVLSWDWIGERSPLVAEKTEPEWVLDRLCESLVRYVSMQGSLDLKEGLGKRNSRDGGRKGSFGSIELA